MNSSSVYAEPQDDEKLRFIGGFGDIFVTIGIALFLGAAGFFLYRSTSGELAAAGIVGVTWILAEYFTKVRRMSLPSIALLIIFATASFMAIASMLNVFDIENTINQLDGNRTLDKSVLTRFALAAFLTSLLTALYYWRFRVPITIAAAALALVTMAQTLIFYYAPDFTVKSYNIIQLISGLSVFALAMAFDISDPQRETRRTDIAFWLHLLAAPWIVGSIIAAVLPSNELLAGTPTTLDTNTAIVVLSVFFALGIIALIIDRRALLVSGLTYAGFAFGTLIAQNFSLSDVVPMTLFALGAFILILSAGWRPLRRIILSLMPSALSRRLHNPNALGST
ncbi:MAG: hypothetical protein H7X92_10765 [Chitinophagales bacterium]|nr:hypothetical protein [Hyphomicrobiales bacterium]